MEKLHLMDFPGITVFGASEEEEKQIRNEVINIELHQTRLMGSLQGTEINDQFGVSGGNSIKDVAIKTIKAKYPHLTVEKGYIE
jgi:hypothetical protein